MQQEQCIYIDKDGDKFYYKNKAMTILHREDGPAVEYASGYKFWYLNDEAFTEEQFNQRMNPVTELTLEDIAEKFGIAVDKLKIKK